MSAPFDPTHGAGGTRRFDRRPGLPSGRSILGGLLVATAGLGAFAVARGEADPLPPARVVVTTDVAPGHVLEPGDLGLAPVELPQGDGQLFDDAGALVGAVTVAPLAAGDIVQASAVVQTTDGARGAAQVSFPVERAGALGGRLRTGERVDVIATFGTGVDAHSRRVASEALVVAADAADERFAAGVTVTVAVARADDVLPITHAANAGTVTLVRTSGAGEATVDAYRTPPADDAVENGSAGDPQRSSMVNGS